MRCQTGINLINEWKQKRDAKQDTADIRSQLREHSKDCSVCYMEFLSALAVVATMAREVTESETN